MNAILKKCYESRGGTYCHVIEVSSAYEIECIIEAIASEGWSKEQLKGFFDTISVYCLNEDNENEIYSFDFNEAIDNLND